METDVRCPRQTGHLVSSSIPVTREGPGVVCSYTCIHSQGCPLTQGWHLLLMFLCLCLEYNLKVTLAEDNFGL